MPESKKNVREWINKYDYLRSFYRPKNHWFHSTDDINDDLSKLIKHFYALQHNVKQKDEDKEVLDIEDDDFFEEEIDTSLEYDSYCENKLCDNPKTISNKNETLDPIALQGLIIDKTSREFIKNKFKIDYIVDFDRESKTSLEEQAIKTLEILKDAIENQKDVILFQSVFRSKKFRTQTKPDALIYYKNNFYLIEVKSTTKIKMSQTFDLLFQVKTIEDVLSQFNKKISHKWICLIEKVRHMKNEISYVFCRNLSVNKGGKSQLSEEDAKEKLKKINMNLLELLKKIDKYKNKINKLQKDKSSNSKIAKISEKITKYNNSIKDLKIAIEQLSSFTTVDQIIENYFFYKFCKKSQQQDIDSGDDNLKYTFDKLISPEKIEEGPKKEKEKRKFLVDQNNNDFFIKRINELLKWEKEEKLNYDPSDKYSSIIADHECFKNIKELYRCSNLYHLFGFTGKFVNYSDLYNSYQKLKSDDPEWFKKTKKDDILQNVEKIFEEKICKIAKPKEGCEKFYKACKQHYNKGKYYISENSYKYFQKEVKNCRKVYFDFESIALPWATFDNVYPYQQLVTQVSVITDNGKGVNKNTKLKENLVIDPATININSIKQIIDAIFRHVPPNEVDSYKFVVYNKNFEKSRLKEMKMFFKDNDHEAKHYIEQIDTIIKCITDADKEEKETFPNIIDLVDYFNCEKPNCGFIWELKGYYSIKYVLNFIMNNDPDVFDQTGCVNYKTLDEVQNGMQAQLVTIQRYACDKQLQKNLPSFEWEKYAISDQMWQDKVNKLKIYCENDVRAMVALEYWFDKHHNNK